MMNFMEVPMQKLLLDVASLASLGAFATMLCVWADMLGRVAG
jgi:hypothetical protein